MTDKQLYKLCKEYGRRALEARTKFAGFLPEVLKRRLYEKKGFSSIYEFAGKLAGLSHEYVDKVLRLERRFEDKPALHQALVTGEISPNKLIRIASIATTQNQGVLFEAAQKLSKQAIDVFVKDYKAANRAKNAERDGLFKPDNDQKSLPGQTSSGPNFDYEILAKLSPEVKNKIKEMMDKNIDINKELLEFFKEREEIIRTEKSAIEDKKTDSRYIPAKIKKIIKLEYGEKCAKPDCARQSENLHHTRGFARTKSHDPHFLKPLCKAHHEITHMDDRYVQEYRRGG